MQRARDLFSSPFLFMKPLTLIISDTHSGGSTALAYPQMILNEGDAEEKKISLSAGQYWLWDCWEEMYKRIKYEVQRKKRTLFTFHLGDMVDGIHHGNVQAITVLDDQEKMAEELLAPIRALSTQMWICVGTAAHVGEVGQSERRIARRLNATLAYEHRVEIEGVLHDLAHHGRVSSRAYYSAATAVAAEVMLECAERGDPVPRFVWRGHRHRINDSGEHFENTRCVNVPCWQLRTHYGYKVSGRPSDIGYILVEGENVEIKRYRPQRRKVVHIRGHAG